MPTHPHFNPLNPELLNIANETLEWCRSFLIQPNPRMKRPGGDDGGESVCPFVKPALERNSLYIVFHPEVNGKNEGAIEELILRYVGPFRQMPPHRDDEQTLKALLIVFPEIGKRDYDVLKKVSTEVKSQFVAQGLMLAPFYPTCRDGSVHDQSFLTSQSPQPLIAMRHMAFHDILFLNDNKEWFDEYNRRFGYRFNEPGGIEKHNNHFIAIYHEAKARFGGR